MTAYFDQPSWGLVLFDIDDTLVNVGGVGAQALVDTIAEVFGVQSPPDAVSMAGRTDAGLVMEIMARAGHSEEAVRSRLSEVWRRYPRRLAEGLRGRAPRACPGVYELLERLGWDGRWRLGLLTGNMEAAGWLKLSAVGLQGFFPCGAFGDEAEDRLELGPQALAAAEVVFGSPTPPEQVVVIGDTPRDVACARGIGARAVAVATGHFSEEALQAAAPDLVLPDLQGAQEVLARLATFLPPRPPRSARGVTPKPVRSIFARPDWDA